jgi:RNA polymerase sigma-70 factor (ECF subfamily)
MSQTLPGSRALQEVLTHGVSERHAPDAAIASNVSDLESRDARLRSIVAEHYSFLWRSLRRLGVPESDVEDAAQKCLWVVAQRLDDIETGKEKTFLFGVALRVAKSAWRAGWFRRRVSDEAVLVELPAAAPGPDEALDDRRARILLDALLEALPLELRTVFILYELEELTMAEIALALGIPNGTVASRLRRARQEFEARSVRIQRQLRLKEGPR